MSNMSYCRFRNTLRDLNDCRGHLDDMPFNQEATDEDKEMGMLSREETSARTSLIKLCILIADEFRDEVEKP
jgi:hypothetical protein